MAKNCSHCNRSYPDHLPACPYCEPGRAKPPTLDEILIEDIEIMADEAPQSPRRKRPAGEPPKAPAEAPGADVIEVAAAKPASGEGDSSKVKLDEPIEVVDVPSDVLAVDEVEAVGSSKIKLDQPIDVANVPSDVLVVDEAQKAESSKVKLERPVEVTSVPSDVLVVDDVEMVGSSKVKLDRPVDVANVPSDVLVVDQADIVEESAPGQPPGPPAQGAQPTRIGARVPVPTMYAGLEDAAAQVAAALAAQPPGAAGAAAPPASPQAPAAAGPPPKRGAPTHIAGRAPAPTMLADTDVAAELPGGEKGGPAAPPPVPRLELDSGKAKGGGDDALEVVGEALEAAAASDVRAEPPIEVVDEVLDVTDGVEVIREGKKTGPSSGKGGAKGAPEDVSGDDVLGDEVLVEGTSEIELERKPPGKGERPSGVDLIAEALESGVDLAGVGPPSPPRPTKAPKRTASDKGSHVDLDEVPVESSESSAVNLGAPESPVRGRSKKGGGEAVSDVAADALLESPSGVEVIGEAAEVVDEDLVAPKKAKGEGAEEVGEATEVVDEDLVSPKAKGKARLAGGEEAEPARKRPARDEEEEEDRPSRRRRERAGGGALRAVGMLVLGVVLALGGFAAVWAFAPDLLKSLPESPKGFKWQQGRDPSKEATPAQRATASAAAELTRGDYEGALARVKDIDTPDAAAIRGEARWQKYLRQQREKRQGLTPNAPDVERAIQDFKEAEAEGRVKEIQNIIRADNDLRKNETALKQAEIALRQALAKVNPKLAKADPKTLAKAMGQLAEEAETLREMSKALAGAKLLKGKSVDKAALDSLIAARAALDAAAKQLNVFGADEVPKAVATLTAASKTLREKLANVNTKLQDAGVKDKDATGVQQLIADRDTLKTNKQELDEAVGQALAELKKGNLVPPGADPKKQLVAGTRAARLKSESPLASSMGSMFSSLTGLGAGAGRLLQSSLLSAADKAELAAAKVRQALSETPEQRLDTWLALYQGRARKDPQDVVSAGKYLDWVNSRGANAGPEMRAKALLALGLAQRNNGQFAEAAKTLKQAVGASAGIKGPPAWVSSARQALKELTDPTAYYLPRAQELRREGRLNDALAELDTGLKAMPNDARLHAQRGVVRLEMALAGGKLGPETQDLVRQDAAAAQKDAAHAAEGYYLLGRLEEQLGNLTGAEQNYKTALKTHQGDPEEASRYRSALARVLLRERQAGAEEEPAPKGKAAETGRLTPAGEVEEQVAATDPRLALLALVMTGVQAGGDGDEDPAQAARLKQATELATELIKSANPKTKAEGYMILAQVYARQGKRGEGILLYVKGLELYHPGKESKELAKLVSEHPAFQQPDTVARYQPLLAERHFGQGLEAFWQRRYPEAEAHFKKAVSYYDQDARYQYFLGLARWQQRTKAKRAAAEYDFAQGARLEAASRPHAYQVNASLERLQGQLRQVLDRYREKAGASE
jgi:hypothetical protein